MTPKEKATELVEKFKPYVYCYLGSGMLTNTYDEGVAMMQAKSCALIAVDETLKCVYSADFLATNGLIIEADATFEYWKQVKAEIELL